MTEKLSWEDPQVGNIIEIPNITSVVINLGFSDGYDIGDGFAIYEPGPMIIDPSTSAVLGRYDHIKENVKITEVYENFSICKKQITVRRASSMTALLEGRSETTFKELNVSNSENKDWKIEHPEIKIGDPIKVD